MLIIRASNNNKQVHSVMDIGSILIVGFGNMGQALAYGLIDAGVSSEAIFAVSPAKKKEADTLGVRIFSSIDDVTISPDVVIFALKPTVMQDVVYKYRHFSKSENVFISIAAGVRIASLEEWLGKDNAIFRVMPNTPACIGCGAAALVANSKCTDQQKHIASVIMNAVGEIVWLNTEEQMDAVTALSGSGPAFYFYFTECLQKSAEDMGLPKDVARKLAVQTFYGAGLLAKLEEGKTNLSELREAVTSPGGTTEAGLNELIHKLEDLVRITVTAATKRSKDLS